jgi:hypothetical protein
MKNSKNMLVHLRLPMSLQLTSKGKSISAMSISGTKRISPSLMTNAYKNVLIGGKTAKSLLMEHLSSNLMKQLRKIDNRKIKKKCKAEKISKGQLLLAVSFPKKAAQSRLCVGVWDLGAWLGNLPQLLEAMNSVQDCYEFVEVNATVPLGMIRTREGVVAWANQLLERKLKPREIKEIQNNTVSNDFFSVAETVRKELRTKYGTHVDYLVGVTPSMVAGERDDDVFWNHFSTFKGRLILASTYDLRSFAQNTKKPFELFLSGIIIAQVLVAQFWSRGLGFHVDNRGCLFDFNGDRTSIMDLVGKVHIEKTCLNYIGARFRTAALALVEFLRNYK